MSEPVHLISWDSREESEVHCGDGLSRWPNTKIVGDVTCGECLRLAEADAAATLRAVTERQRQLGNLARPKDWNACPYESHANDCDCRGMGGDR